MTKTTMVKQGLVLWLVLSALLLAPMARASQSILESQAYWLDESGKATFNEAMNSHFVSFDGSLTKGFKPYALWVKLRISGQTSKEQIAVIVKPPFLREIALYDPTVHTDDGSPMSIVSGRDASLSPANHIGIDNGFVIPSSTMPRDIFLRITTTTTLAIDIDVQSLDNADQLSHVTAAIMALYFAFLLAFLLWSLVTWTVRRDLLYGLFALRLVFSMLHLFVMGGLLRYFLSDNLSVPARDNAYNLVLVSIVAVTSAFDFKLISEFGVPRWLQRFAWSLLSLPAVSLLLLSLGRVQAALQFNALVVMVVVIMNVVLAFSAHDSGNAPYGKVAIHTIRIGFALMAMVVIAPVLITTNMLGVGVPVLKLVYLHAVISTIILFAILSIRARQKDLLAQKSLVQYEITERELQQESERRAEKERFLSMLVHELRNPLSVIRLKTSESSASGKAVHQAVLEMSQIIERVEQSETLDHAVAQGRKSRVSLAAVVREIAVEHPASTRLDVDAARDISVVTDEDLFRSIVRNLLDNAWKYSPETSRIIIMVAEIPNDGADGALVSIVNDVGDAGVPDAGKLFTKYYRTKGAHRRPGSGLGLFLVASWAKTLGGNVSYEQTDGASGNPVVRFSLWLPQ